MPGPAPKLASQRSRRNAPVLGEWRTLPPITDPVLPELPPLYDCDERTMELLNGHFCMCGREFKTAAGLKTHLRRQKAGLHDHLTPTIHPKQRWSQRTVDFWEGLRFDFVTQEYGESEIQQALQIAYLFEDAIRADKAATLWGEVRQWMDRLMLTPKGKRDARVLLQDQPATVSKVGNLVVPDFKRRVG